MTQPAFYQWGYDISEKRFFILMVIDGEQKYEASFSWQ